MAKPKYWTDNRRQTVRLACPCGRNLADVEWVGNPPAGVVVPESPRLWPEHLWPYPRPGVRQAEHDHGGGRFTFRWDCRCGRTWEVHSDRTDAAWREHARTGRIIRLILGHDV